MAGSTITAFRYVDARARGATRGEVQRAVDSGQIVRLIKGIYAKSDAELDQLAAAVLRIGDDAVVSHETAAAVWGIPILGRRPAEIQLTRPRRRTGLNRFPQLAVHHAGLPDQHRTVCQGVPLTTPARTVADLARVGRFRAGVVAADGALRLRRCTREQLLAVADDCARWPGVRRARQVALFADARAASPLESISRVAFHSFGLPRPQLQIEMPSFDIVDFLWDAYRVVGEADGLSKYTGLEIVRKEKYRQERLENDGFTVIRWTWQDAFRRPDALAYRAGVILYRRGWRPKSGWQPD